MTSHKGLILPFPIQIFEDASPGNHADDALIVHDRKNFQMFYNHDGCNLFYVSFGVAIMTFLVISFEQGWSRRFLNSLAYLPTRLV